MMNEPHPWGVFINARWRAMLWMREELGYSDAVIADAMCMDEMQVYLILASTDMPIPDGKRKGMSEWKLMYKPPSTNIKNHPKYDLIKKLCANEKVIDLRDREVEDE